MRVTGLEAATAAAKPPSSLEAYDLALRGRDLLSRVEHARKAQARSLLECAIDLDPGYAPVHVGLRHADLTAVTQGQVPPGTNLPVPIAFWPNADARPPRGRDRHDRPALAGRPAAVPIEADQAPRPGVRRARKKRPVLSHNERILSSSQKNRRAGAPMRAYRPRQPLATIPRNPPSRRRHAATRFGSVSFADRVRAIVGEEPDRRQGISAARIPFERSIVGEQGPRTEYGANKGAPAEGDHAARPPARACRPPRRRTRRTIATGDEP